MCGIAGFVGRHGVDAVGSVREMVDALARRGPDSEGMASFGSAVLGHRRLAIFDLSAAGHQPMVSEDRLTAVVFNGAIYNFRDLRRELEHRGCRFRSETDTEVLIHGYREWGIASLVGRLRGMFAFAIWDARSDRLLLVRDRLGVKPLCYHVGSEGLAFASTPRALAAAGLTSEIDDASVAEFLEFGYVSEQRSIFQNIRKLPPATIAEWDGATLEARTYWTPPDISSAPRLQYEDVLARTEELLLQAVRRRLEADVPVGALLSAGIDSALVCWAVRSLDAKVTAYTVGSPGHEDDESAGACATARELGIEHRVLELAGDHTPDIARLTAAFAEPFACDSALGMLSVSETIAAAGIKVLLTGDGGDDVFLGYPRHRHLRAAQLLATVTPAFATDIWSRLRPSDPRRARSQRAVHFIDYVTGGLPAFLDAHEGLPEFARRRILGARLEEAGVWTRGQPRSVAAGRRLLGDYLAHDWQSQFVSEYLTKVDGATMYHALEARSPLLDQELWEWAACLPLAQRMRGWQLKSILRDIARRRVSERLATLPKKGFGVPVLSWLGTHRQSIADEYLRESVLASGGWIRVEPLLQELDSLSDGRPVSRQLWYVVVLESWMRAERSTRGYPQSDRVTSKDTDDCAVTRL